MATEVLRLAAFTLDGSGGNPAGVVYDADELNTDQRLAIAADLGYSETAFLNRPTGRSQWPIRYYSPQAEVAFCGHATIAAAVSLAQRFGTGPMTLSASVGPIELQTRLQSDGAVVATLTSVPTRSRPAGTDELTAALSALHWTSADLDPAYPPHVAFAGVQHLILLTRSRATLAALDYDFGALSVVMAARGWTTVDLLWAESASVFHCRNPFPPGGVVEDPATGAAAAAFGGYLRQLNLVPVPSSITITQGADMGRPSRLVVNIPAGSGGIEVTGTAAPIDDPTPQIA